MTPKEKATELCSFFSELFGMHDRVIVVNFCPNIMKYSIKHAKECAIKCVDEIIKHLIDLEQSTSNWDRQPYYGIDYWNEVIKHIKTM